MRQDCAVGSIFKETITDSENDKLQIEVCVWSDGTRRLFLEFKGGEEACLRFDDAPNMIKLCDVLGAALQKVAHG